MNQEALSIELSQSEIPFIKERKLSLKFKGQLLEKCYFADFVCFGKIIIEVKAVEDILDEYIAQVLNYLKATQLRLGLLVNFGSSSL